MDNSQENNRNAAKVAQLESQIDHLEAEMSYLNGLLFEVGFPEGIKTLKETAEELLQEGAPFQRERFQG